MTLPIQTSEPAEGYQAGFWYQAAARTNNCASVSTVRRTLRGKIHVPRPKCTWWGCRPCTPCPDVASTFLHMQVPRNNLQILYYRSLLSLGSSACTDMFAGSCGWYHAQLAAAHFRARATAMLRQPFRQREIANRHRTKHHAEPITTRVAVPPAVHAEMALLAGQQSRHRGNAAATRLHGPRRLSPVDCPAAGGRPSILTGVSFQAWPEADIVA